MKRKIPILIILLFFAVFLTACGGGGSSTGGTTYTVTANAGIGGSINPTSASINSGTTTSFTIIPNSGNSINTVTGCGGTLVDTTYTTGIVTANCTVTASFISNALPSISISSASANEGDNGTTNLSFTVTLSAPSSGSINVDYITSDGSATAGSDYTSSSGTLTIAAGNAAVTVTVNVSGDTSVEANETLTLTLSNPTGATLGTATATGTIINDDSASALPTINIGSSTIDEGNSGTTNLNFFATLSALSSSSVSVDYATSDDSTTAGSDYTAMSGTVTIPAGSLSGRITVSILGDTIAEADERLVLTLSNPVGAVLGTSTAGGIIINDDASPPPVPSIWISGINATVAEGDAGSSLLKFGTGLSFVTSNDVTFSYATSDGTATAGSDYTATNGVVTIPAGTSSTEISIEVLGDTILEGDEILVLNLSNPSGANLLTNLVTGIIRNDDAAPTPLPIVRVGPDINYIWEAGNNGATSLSFLVGLNPLADRDVTVDYATADASATAGSDYIAVSGTVTIPAGSNRTTITVNVLDDTANESDEAFTLALSNPVGANLSLASRTATGLIRNDDSPTGVATLPSINIADASVIEGDDGIRSLRFDIKFSNMGSFVSVRNEAMVDYSTQDATANAGSDYTASSGTLTIPAGSYTATIFIDILSDTDIEGDETLTLTLSNPSSNIMLGRASATGIILHDDEAFTPALNDTGITTCSDATNNNLICPAGGFPGQDADSGRDFTHNYDGDGHAGYSFTKLDSNGQPLADQGNDYTTTPWDCVKDNVTGLTWEVKTDDGGLRDRDWSYSWYNSTGINDGGSAGVANAGTCVDSTNCDTEKYVTAVNTVGLCGQVDWRVPSVEELINLRDDKLTRSIDRGYFPNIQWIRGDYLSSSPVADSPGSVWAVDFEYSRMTTSGGVIRLVRGSP